MRGAILVSMVFGLAAAAIWGASRTRIERADFVFNNGAEIATLDPAATSGVPEGRMMYALYEGLTVKHPETLEPMPGVAESWSISQKGRLYRFRLRPDARWSNGDLVTAADFEWSWRRLLEAETAAEYAYQLWCVDGAREYTLLPGDRDYDAAGHMWLKKLDNGLLRIGGSGFSPCIPSVKPRLGERTEDTPLCNARTRHPVGSPVAGRIVSVNPDIFHPQNHTDPYERFWWIEIEPDPKALEEALERGALLSAERARDEIFWPQVGIRAVDWRTLEVSLESPTPYFLALTSFFATMPVHRKSIEKARKSFPESWQVEWLRPERLVTNGPFLLKERRLHDRIRLAKNPRYWDALNVAFNTIDVLAVESYSTMLNLYLTGEVDWIERCAPNLVPRMMDREDYNPVPYLGSYFYRVNVQKKPFDDKRVRRALALAIDRQAIVSKVTKKGETPSWSLCPPGLSGYERAEMSHAAGDDGKAYARDCAEALALMDAAGFGPGKERFPTFEIHYNKSESHRDIAEVVADTWRRVLGVDVQLLNQEWKTYLDTQRTFNYDVSRSAWIQDYPDPNTFIEIFVSGGKNNRTRWSHEGYDALVREAGLEADIERRLDLLQRAEAILLEELPILPIFAYTTNNAVHPRLGGFFENSQDDHYPKFWYWMDDAELAAKRAGLPRTKRRIEASGPSAGLYPPAGRDAVIR